MLSNVPGASYTDLRIASASAKFNQLAPVLRDSQIGMSTRRLILEACVRSRLCYAVQAERPSAAEMKRLESCWHGCLRRMVRGGFRRKGAAAGADVCRASCGGTTNPRCVVCSQSVTCVLEYMQLTKCVH